MSSEITVPAVFPNDLPAARAPISGSPTISAGEIAYTKYKFSNRYKIITIAVEISSERGMFRFGFLISEPMYVAEFQPLYANMINMSDNPADFHPLKSKWNG